MRSVRLPLLLLLALAPAAALAADPPADAGKPSWKECLKQAPEWYAGEEAARVAANVLLLQQACGGWPKDPDCTRVFSEKQKASARKGTKQGSIDNDATTSHMIFLARVGQATGATAPRGAFLKGLAFLLEAQYPNGGWPQEFPGPAKYRARITFNDDAMANVLELLREVAKGAEPYAFVPAERRAEAAAAVDRGIACILKCQVVVEGRRTAWCAQHDEATFAPAEGRSFEKASLSGRESVQIVRVLMGIENPPPEVVEAVEAAVLWFRAARLQGLKVVEKPDPALRGGRDVVVVPDPTAAPLWARCYEIGANRPFFCGRDGAVKATLAEIEHERRVGYSWYTEKPGALLDNDYSAWKERLEAKAKELPPPRDEIARQLELLKAGDAEKLKACFTERLRDRITPEEVEKGRAEAGAFALDDLVASVETGEWEGKKTAKIKMRNGRTLTTLVWTGERWLADTVWFR
ncbi:MAG: pectate lyase [Planctomycetes bacterium]|jgi:PelA/Pel-15E family pectate lyase|nr:pectate lyase [Planctomycetota bacterium]